MPSARPTSAATQAKVGAEHIEGSARRAGRAGSQLLRVDLVEFGVVEQQAIVVLPADVVS
jgi:hypothetical protein